jgi:threonine/homoserine/homoserine lactone efflux protein
MTELWGLVLFAFVSSITPGPNNLMLLNLGKSYPLRTLMGVMSGIFFGFFCLLLVSGYGLGTIIELNTSVF